MSYSYLKNVFPNFESSMDYQNKVYNEVNINTVDQTKPFITPLESINNNSLNKLNQFTQSLIGAPFDKESSISKSTVASIPIQLKSSFPQIPLKEEVNTIEKFEDDEPNCDFYTRHVLGCQRCRSIIMKQLNMDNDRIRNEEIMELVTYIVFGIFILLLIDILKNK